MPNTCVILEGVWKIKTITSAGAGEIELGNGSTVFVNDVVLKQLQDSKIDHSIVNHCMTCGGTGKYYEDKDGSNRFQDVTWCEKCKGRGFKTTKVRRGVKYA